MVFRHRPTAFRVAVPIANCRPSGSSCGYCGLHIYRWDCPGILVDPWWKHLIDRIKRHLCCESCRGLEVISGLPSSFDPITANVPKASLKGTPFIEIWDGGLAEGFYGEAQHNEKSATYHGLDRPKPGSRKHLHTGDLGRLRGEKFSRRNKVMERFTQQGGWSKSYLPEHLYCFDCMSEFEGWAKETESDTSHLEFKLSLRRCPEHFHSHEKAQHCRL